jgi:hypothetical protein
VAGADDAHRRVAVGIGHSSAQALAGSVTHSLR